MRKSHKPYIVGIVALIREAYPDLTPFQVKTVLYHIAQHNREKALKDSQATGN